MMNPGYITIQVPTEDIVPVPSAARQPIPTKTTALQTSTPLTVQRSTSMVNTARTVTPMLGVRQKPTIPSLTEAGRITAALSIEEVCPALTVGTAVMNILTTH